MKKNENTAKEGGIFEKKMAVENPVAALGAGIPEKDKAAPKKFGGMENKPEAWQHPRVNDYYRKLQIASMKSGAGKKTR